MKTFSNFFIVVVITGVLQVSSTDGWNCNYEGCECYRGGINCVGANWKTLPQLLDSHTEESPSLDLQYNFLTTIENGSLPVGLSEINFRNNPLLTIDPTALDGSSDTLRKLSFSDAKFTQIPAALTHLNALMDLSVQDTQILQWDVDMMKHIGLTLMYLTLDNVSLTSWPDWIQYCTHLQTMEMTSSFKSIPDNAFDKQNNTLTTLRLLNGNLTETSLSFSKLSALTTLVLDYNNISKISKLPNFGTLSSISIQYNRLSNATHLSDVLRSVSNSLTYLQAEGNQLSSFPDLSFMAKLQSVYLSHNLISDTSSGSITSSVSYLEAENNNIRSLAGFLSGGINLKYLRLMGNSVTSLLGDNIPSNISEFDISRNLITELTDTSFPENTLMDSLWLDYNPISQISTAAFAGLSNLDSLSLKGTRLTRLPLALSLLTGLYTLVMSDSSDLVCSCLEKPLRSWYLSRPLACFGDCGPLPIDYFLGVLSVGCP